MTPEMIIDIFLFVWMTSSGGFEKMKNICDYMIIQRDSKGFGTADFSGYTEPCEDLLVVARVVNEYNNTMVVPWQECVLEDGHWHITLKIPQGGLYRVEARRSEGSFDGFTNSYDWGQYIAVASHVGVGDVFILAGQSNMSGYGKDPAYDPPELGVHLFNNAAQWVLATHPLGSVPEPVYPNNDPASGVSPGLAFGKAMHRALGVPIGLVSAARGGSSLESWNPANADDCFLYDSMIEKYNEVGSAAGIVWYQGCNETNEEEAGRYYENFSETVILWREKLGSLPIVTCQINRHAFAGDNDRMWGLVRDAQRRAALTIDNVYLVPTCDLPCCDGIHNTSGSCVTVGERMAGVLLAGYYGLPGFTAAMILKAEKTGRSTIKLHISEGHCLRTMDNNACGMNIEDETGLMNCTEVKVSNGDLIVEGEREISGKAVFHAYWKKMQPAFFVRDIYGMPVSACYNLEIEE